jgi:MFS family permease
MNTIVPAGSRPRRGRRRLVLAICCLSLFIAGIDVTIVNVALPSIQRSLHASVSGLQWTVDVYTLVLACLAGGLPRASGGGGLHAQPGRHGDHRQHLHRPAGTGLGGGHLGSVVGLSLAVGPVLGGELVSGLGWRSIFWITIPVGIATIAATQRFVPESTACRARRLDPWAQALMVVMLGSVTYAIIEGPQRGWGSPLILGLFGLGVLAAAALVAVETRRREPVIDVRFFRSVPFGGASVIAVAAFASLGGFLFLNTLYLQDVRGYSALDAGLLTVPMAVMIAVFATVSGRLTGRRGPRLPFVLADPALAAGALLLARLTRAPRWPTSSSPT